jgi:hypothetical protein
MDEKSLGFVNQLIEKTEQGKLSWSTGFEDGQFKTLLPEGKLAFVVQVNGPTNRFMMLDDGQEVILQERVNLDEANRAITVNPKMYHLYQAIDRLNKLARTQALQVNEKLAKAEKLLATI